MSFNNNNCGSKLNAEKLNKFYRQIAVARE